MAANVIWQAGSTAEIQSYLTSSSSGIALTPVSLAGSLTGVGVFESLNLGGTLSFDRGVLLTCGTGTPSRTNSSTGFTSNRQDAGDADLTQFAFGAFSGAGATHDASVLTLSFTISDPNIKSIKFDLAFGSDEYPEYSDSSYVEVGAVWTGSGIIAHNYALVNGNANAPLSVTGQNASLGNFVSNLSGGYQIEYDCILNKQSIFVPVSLGENLIKLGVADTGDFSLDSGLFISGIAGSSVTTGVDSPGSPDKFRNDVRCRFGKLSVYWFRTSAEWDQLFQFFRYGRDLFQWVFLQRYRGSTRLRLSGFAD